MSVIRCILFDWGDTLMRVFPEYPGPMKDWPQVALVKGAVGTLSALHGHYHLALATNAADSTQADIGLALQRVGLSGYLDGIYCYQQVRQRKPSREFYGFILEDLDLRPDQVVMVGDDYEADALGALACGLRAVWLSPGADAPQPHERLRVIKNLHQLVKVVHEWDGAG